MLNRNKLSAGKKRLLLALVGIVGLSVIATVVYNCFSEKKQIAAAPAATIAAPSENTQAQQPVAIENITDITVIEPPAAEEKPVQQPVRRKSRAYARNKVAMKFPAPPVGVQHAGTPSPESLVEMWRADRKSVIAVPPGIKTAEE